MTRKATHLTATGRSAALVEQGAAFMELEGRRLARSGHGGAARGPASTAAKQETFDVVVVGGGQAGLSVGHHLARHGVSFVILDAGERIGDVWRRRWDSLRLFTCARFDGLDGMAFPAPPDSFPTKDAMADYLEAYAARFDLPVRTGTRVTSLTREGGRYVAAAGERRFLADNVVVAAASYQAPKVPGFARDLDPGITQIHSCDYRNPGQIRDGGVLIVGAGNSGAEIAMELAPRHKVWLAGRDTGHVPFRIESALGRKVLVRLVLRGLFHRVLTVATPIGRKVRPVVLSQGGPLIRTKPRDLKAAGVVRVPRVTGVRDGLPQLVDGRVLEVTNVVWCTGFDRALAWIKLPLEMENGEPRHERGVVSGQPGLYFVGMHFLYALSSTMIHGVGRDARRIAEAAAARVTTRQAA